MGLASACALLLAAAAASPLHAQDAAFNPKPDRADVILPMPGDYKMVFVRVPLPGQGVLGGSERIFEIGGEKGGTQPFEYPRLARIGGTFTGKGGESYLVVGKYEVTIGQYAAVTGDGDLAKGIEHLRQISQIDPIPASGAESDIRFLSRPVHGINYDDHLQFISHYNTWCLKTPACIAALRRDLGGVGAFRLPVEYEWEFVARGGSRAPLPFDSSAVGDFAFINNPRRNFPDPIGQKKPLPGLPIYDIFGNVSEFMGVPFTLDNGAGAVGGWVARGGDYKTSLQALRVSLREEIRQFFRMTGEKGADVFQRTRPREAGIRLVVGAPIRDPDNKGIEDQIAKEFQAYVPLGDGKGGIPDIAGNTRADAKNLGTIDPRKAFTTLTDSVGGTGDPADWFTFIVPQYGVLHIELAATSGDVALEYRHAAEEEGKSITATNGRKTTLNIERVLPGQVYLRAYSARGGEARYAINIGFDVQDRAGNTTREAADLGTIDGKNIEIVDYVGPGDKFDVYKFTTGRTDTISARLLDLTGDVDMELLGSNEQVLKTSNNPRTLPELIDHANATPGTYYLRVFSKDDKPAIYKLLLSLGVLDTAGNTRATARDIGTLTSDVISIEEHLSSTDKTDFFKFRVNGNSRLTVQVARHTSDVDLYIYDAAGKELGKSDKPGSEAEKVEIAVTEGTYYIEVRNDGNQLTNYFMTAEVRPLAPYTHRDLAYKLPAVSSSPMTWNTSFNDEARSRFAEFQVTSGSLVRITMDTVRADPKTDIDLFLSDSKGDEIDRSVLTGSAPEEIVERLEPGTYMIRMFRHEGSVADVRLSVATTSQPIPPTLPGRTVSRHEDWEVKERTIEGKKECVAYTVAKDVSPSGMRGKLPHLYFGVNPGEDGVFHSFDRASYYNVDRGFQATIENRTGGGFNIPIKLSGPDVSKAQLRSLVPCSNNNANMCVSTEGLRGLTRGSSVTLRGTSKDGRQIAIRYSLVGYQAAVRAMNEACNNTSKTGWLIK